LEEILSRGTASYRSGAWEDALACFDLALRLQPQRNDLHNIRARVCEQLGRLDEALNSIDCALQIEPGNLADLRNRASLLRRLGKPEAALSSLEAALALGPDDADTLVRRAMILNEVDRRDEALDCIERASRIQPDSTSIVNARVIILDNLGRYQEALLDLDRMLANDPDHLDAINNTGMILARIGELEKALICYDRSLALQSDQPQARYNRSLVRLGLGDWIRGFQEFESRWSTPPLQNRRPHGLGPLWTGEEDVNRKTVLLYHEQGYGDTLQCLRYVPQLTTRGASVILAVPEALRRLALTVPGVSQVVSGGEPLPHHDFQSPLMSLPLAFRTTPDTIPAPIPYLRAEKTLLDRWARRLGPRVKFRIGLVWGGRRYAPINYPRDIPLDDLRPLLELDAQFISLQKEVTACDRPALATLRHLELLGENLEDFADTAALIEQLDLVITVDTAIVHLAGALGKPVWLLNRKASCWRWLQSGTDSPWYPTLRQFRQVAVGDWNSVVHAVREAATVILREPPPKPVLPTVRADTAPPEVIRFVCATRVSQDEFFRTAPLGRSLPLYQGYPRNQVIELRLFADNRAGLPSVYNIAIEEARSKPAILVFIHDDVFLSDYHWATHLHTALGRFQIVGLAGNRRRVSGQASWMYLDGQFTRDNYDNLSGVIGHGASFPGLRQLSIYGAPGQEAKLLDGVMLAARSQLLIQRELRFDPRFQFDFYDMDFCRQAEARGIRMGTWPISIIHGSAGKLGGPGWRSAYADYLAKYNE